MIDNRKSKRIIATIKNNEQEGKSKMFTKGRIFKNRQGVLTFQVVHIESDRIAEIKFLLTEGVLIIN